MKDFQQRVVEEKAQLDDKITRLGAFFASAVFPTLASDDQHLLREQHIHMQKYSEVLSRRIARF
jgi:hypothetical protein